MISTHAILTRTLLIGSFLIFAAGASIPAGSGFWGMSFIEGLNWVAAHPGHWTLTNVLFIISFLSGLAGLVLFNQYTEPGTVRAIANIGFTIFLIGSIFWLIELGFRLRFEPWAASLISDGAELPDIVFGLRQLQNIFFNLFMSVAFLGAAVYGAALILSPSFTNAAGWFLAGYNLFFGVVFVTTGGPIPIMVLVGPLVLGLIAYPV